MPTVSRRGERLRFWDRVPNERFSAHVRVSCRSARVSATYSSRVSSLLASSVLA